MIIKPTDLRALDPKNRFLVLDGVNGAGKTTVLRHLVERLGARGEKTTATFEPGDTELGRALRPLVLDPSREKPAPMSELMIFAADRAEHVTKLLRPALSRGEFVVSDRYYYSSEAFQGYGRGLALETVRELNTLAIDGLLPGLLLLLDLDPREGLRRTRLRRGADAPEDDALELETIAFHERIRQGFLDIAARVSEPVLIVDAGKPQADVLKFIDSVAAKL